MMRPTQFLCAREGRLGRAPAWNWLLAGSFVLVLLSAATVHARTEGIVKFFADTGTFDENVNVANTIDAEAVGNPWTMAAFKTAVSTAYANDLGGVITFDHSRGLDNQDEASGRFTWFAGEVNFGLGPGTSGRAGNYIGGSTILGGASTGNYDTLSNNGLVSVVYGASQASSIKFQPDDSYFWGLGYAQLGVWTQFQVNSVCDIVSGNYRNIHGETQTSGAALSVNNGVYRGGTNIADTSAGKILFDTGGPSVKMSQLGMAAWVKNGETYTATAYYSGGTTEARSYAASPASQDVFMGFQAPAGQSITALEWKAVNTSTGAPGDRASLDDLTFILDSTTSYNWKGASGANWGTAANWSGGVVPGAGKVAVLSDAAVPGGTNVNLDADVQVAGVYFNTNTGGGNRIVSGAGKTLTLSDIGDAMVKVEGTGHEIAVPVVLATDMEINAGSGTLTISGPISTSPSAPAVWGGIKLVDGFTGTLVLNGANTFTGPTVPLKGTLRIDHPLALQNSALDTDPYPATFGSVVLNGGASVVTDPTFGGLQGGDPSTSRNLNTIITPANGYSTMTSLTLNPKAGFTATYYGVIAEGATGMKLIKTGAGTQVLASANLYTGGTTVSGGELRVLGNSSTGNGPVEVQNTAMLSGTGTIAGAVTVQNGGTLAPGGAQYALPGVTTAGTLTINNTLTLDSGAILKYNLGTSSDLTSVTTVSLGANKTLSVIPGSGFSANGTVAYNLIKFSGADPAAGYDTGWSLDGVADLDRTIALSGTSPNRYLTVTFTGGNYWAPGLTGGGTGNWSNTDKVWATAAGAQGNKAFSPSGALVFTDAAGTATVNGTVNVFGGMTFSTTGYEVAGGTSPKVVLVGSNTITTDPGVTATISAPLGGGDGAPLALGNLTKAGTGTLILSGANSFNNTTVSAGTLSLTGAGKLGAGSLTVNGNAALNLGGTAQTVRAVSVTTAATSGDTISAGSLTGTSYTISPAASTNAVIAANLLANGEAGLTLGGAGTVTLSGSNTYTGLTALNSGTLAVGSSGALPAGGAWVFLGNSSGSTAASLLVNGAYTVGREVRVQAGNTGLMTLGGSNTGGKSTFTGNVVMQKTVTLTAGSGGETEFSGAISGAFPVTVSAAGGTVTLSGSNSYSGGVSANAGTLQLKHEDAIPVPASTTGQNLYVGPGSAGAKLVVNAGLPKAVQVRGLTMDGGPSAPTGTVDLTSGQLVIDGTVTSLANVTAMVKSGYNPADPDNPWKGPGITSSTAATDAAKYAVGLALNGDFGELAWTTWFGRAVDNNSVLVRFTYGGDVDLNGEVTTDDFDNWKQGYVTLGSGWLHGDLDYSGDITTDDFDLWKQTYVKHYAPLPDGSGGGRLATSAVPEPGVLVLLALGGLGLLAWRRRK